jgi:hypothetical protein
MVICRSGKAAQQRAEAVENKNRQNGEYLHVLCVPGRSSAKGEWHVETSGGAYGHRCDGQRLG